MNIWELALLVFALTYMVVNGVYLAITVKMLTEMKGMWRRSIKLCEKMFDATEKSFEDD